MNYSINITKKMTKKDVDKLTTIELSLLDYFINKDKEVKGDKPTVDSMKSLNKKFALWEKIATRGCFILTEKITDKNIKNVTEYIITNNKELNLSFVPVLTLNGDGSTVIDYKLASGFKTEVLDKAEKTFNIEKYAKAIVANCTKNGISLDELYNALKSHAKNTK